MNRSRAALRTFYKQQRACLTAKQRNQKRMALNHQLINFAPLQTAHTVGAFLATPDEADVNLWIEHFWRQGGQVALPKVEQSGGMFFLPYTPDSQLQLNRYNIAEPSQGQPVSPEAFDAVLVPLVAFDDHGNRLGMGGGYYDRYLPQLRPDAYRIGVAFSNQHSSETLPNDTWDVTMHAVVTEDGVLEWRH